MIFAKQIAIIKSGRRRPTNSFASMIFFQGTISGIGVMTEALDFCNGKLEQFRLPNKVQKDR